ncbi:hypothetical protein [Helicobacter sp. MIT 05-5294]|uniref:hypothetical protein n=1 Tax=Helicobacter sp. MIT 05-5294 TaxID=1548150 RepID=UPI001EE89D33|nr:hypothetical protein [Helicobacter sp. MIT 05-5294]
MIKRNLKKYLQNLWIALMVSVLVMPPFANASGKYLSPLPIPNIEVLNIESQKCNSNCLKSLLEEEQIFSFIANIDEKNQNKELLEQLNNLLAQLEIAEIPYYAGLQKPFFNVALLFPRKTIGRYSSTTTNTILSYLLAQKGSFNFEVFDSGDESQESLQGTLDKIYSKGHRQIIAILTQEGVNNLQAIHSDVAIFIPSVHKSQIQTNIHKDSNLIFGGISYEAQIQKLSEIHPYVSATSFYDSGNIGAQMQQYTQAANENLKYSKSFSIKQGATLQKEIKALKGVLQGTRIFLNTPITNSSIILSQLTYNSIRPDGVFSTQINYNQSLLSITQERDRKNMYIANSISPLDSLFVEQARLLDVDLEYDWINYATAYGIEYFYRKSVPSAKRYFKERIKENQVQYNIEILTPANNRFVPL